MKLFRPIVAMVILFTVMLCPTQAAERIVDAEECSVEEMKEFLLSRDYPADYLDTLIPPQISNLYQIALEKDAYFYGFITADTNTEITPYGNISAEQLNFSVTMSYNDIRYDGDTYFGEIFISVNYNWDTLPVIRGIDAITVNWDSSVLKYGGDNSFTSYDYFRHPGTNQWETYKTWQQPNELNQGGLGIDTYLDSGGYIDSGTMWGYATGLAGSVNFSLKPNGVLSMKIAPDKPTTINATYTHNKNPLGGGLSYTYSGFSISVSPGVLQDSIATGHTIWYTEA